MSAKIITIIVTKGSLDWAYPPLILASTATALGYECRMFFTFYGLQLLKRNLRLQASPLGNPALGSRVPVLIQTLPGMQAIFTRKMREKLHAKGVADIEELRQLCLDADVKMYACQMTAELHSFSKKDFIPGVEYAGAATFFQSAGESDICLFT
ncbi:sulfur carrier protein DsrE2 [Thioalkalivibrio sp.]|uniref:sulfur carrier protein DsrE2 n=1 Tax=Thioalkalivibrio sp. TaxID=2093813 RepID=UPI0035691C2A